MLQVILIIVTLYNRIIDLCSFYINPSYNIRIDFLQGSKIYSRPLPSPRLSFIIRWG